MVRGAAVLVFAATCLLAGCGREAALPLEQEQFVEVMVSLRRASQESSSPSDFEARKRVILQKAGVTEDQLRAYARAAPRDPRALAEAYDSIAARLQRYHEPE